MFYRYNDSSIRYIGRFAPYKGSMTATAPGAQLEIAFSGEDIVLYFDTSDYENPVPHIYLQLDGGALFESAIYKRIKIKACAGEHFLRIIYKSAVEAQSRFFFPLVGKISFEGYKAEANSALPEDNRKSIEFIGDSITEGVLTEADLEDTDWDQPSRPHVDDVTSTYAWRTAEHFGLRDLHMGYGAVGTTHGGQGGVPKAAEAYPYCFEGAPVTYSHPDYILINHGANDKWSNEPENYRKEYTALLELVRKTHPDSVIICLAAFCEAYPDVLAELVDDFNCRHNDSVHFINASLWVPADPLHPAREGHKIIADKLIKELENIIK